MFDISGFSRDTLVGLGGVIVLGILVAIAFYRSHRAFKERERLYSLLCDRIKRGEQVSSVEYKDFSPEDRAALQAMQLTRQTMSKQRSDATSARVSATTPRSESAMAAQRG